MDPISNADRLVLLLREKLEARVRSGLRSGDKVPAVAPQPESAVNALAAAAGVDEHTLRRAVIENLLADQLGPALLNDAQFQQVVTRVTDAIEGDPGACVLLNEVVGALRRT